MGMVKRMLEEQGYFDKEIVISEVESVHSCNICGTEIEQDQELCLRCEELTLDAWMEAKE